MRTRKEKKQVNDDKEPWEIVTSASVLGCNRFSAGDDYDVWVIELLVPAKSALLLQAWLLGEDGLGVVRCLDPKKKKQQFWTTVCQRNEAHDWLQSLPEHFKVTGEWLWRQE